MYLDKINNQQKGIENTTAWAVGEQIKEMCAGNPHWQEIIDEDLDNSELSLQKAAESIKKYADKNRGSKSVFCVTPKVAEKIIKDLYKLPDEEVKSQFIDLKDFL